MEIVSSTGTAIASAISASTMTALLGDANIKVNLAGYSVPAFLVSGIITGVSSGMFEFGKSWIIPKIIGDNAITTTTGYIVVPLIVGGINVGVAYVLSGGSLNDMTGTIVAPMVIGSLSYVIGSYTGNYIDDFIKSFSG